MILFSCLLFNGGILIGNSIAAAMVQTVDKIAAPPQGLDSLNQQASKASLFDPAGYLQHAAGLYGKVTGEFCTNHHDQALEEV